MSDFVTYKKVPFSITFRGQYLGEKFFLFDFLVPQGNKEEMVEMILRSIDWVGKLRAWFTLEDSNLLNRYILYLDNLAFCTFNDILITDLKKLDKENVKISSSWTYDIHIGNEKLEYSLSNEEFIAKFCTSLI